MFYRSGAALKPKPSPPRGRGQRQAYPPPIAGAAPGGLNGVFQGLEKTAWAAFMQELELLIEVPFCPQHCSCSWWLHSSATERLHGMRYFSP